MIKTMRIRALYHLLVPEYTRNDSYAMFLGALQHGLYINTVLIVSPSSDSSSSSS